MKRVFRLQGKGNMKDIGLRGVGAYPQVEDLNAKVAIIQALIPLGLQAVQDLVVPGNAYRAILRSSHPRTSCSHPLIVMM